MAEHRGRASQFAYLTTSEENIRGMGCACACQLWWSRGSATGMQPAREYAFQL